MIRIVLLQYEHRIVTIRNKLQYEMLPKRIAAIRIVSNVTNYRIVTIRMLAVRYFFHSTIRTSGEKTSIRIVLFWVFWQPKSGLKNAGSSTNRTDTVRIVLLQYERTVAVRIVLLRYAAYCGGMIRIEVWVFWQPKSGAEKRWIKYASYCYGTYRTAPVRTYCASMHRIVTIRSVPRQYDSYRRTRSDTNRTAAIRK